MTPPSRPAVGGRGGSGRRRGGWALVAVVVVALAVIGWIVLQGSGGAHGPGGRGGGRGGAGGRGGPGGPGAVTSVNAAKTGVGDVPIYLDALGTVTPPATVTVQAQVAGQLFAVDFREGQLVTKGQLLAQVDPRPYQAALGQAQGALARDEAALTNAKLDLQRYQLLLRQDSIASQQVDTQAATVRQDEGTVALDRASVQSARVNLGYTRITAPVSGRVGLRQIDPGNYVSTGNSNGLVTIAQIEPIDVVFTIPEDAIPQVMQRMRTGVRLVATAFDRAQTKALENGYLLTLDNQIDTTTGTVKAKARFANDAGQLFPNQFVNLRLLVDTLHGAVIAPSSAILRGQNGLFAWVVDNDRSVHMRAVTTGPVESENTAVLTGLQAGETVVTDGSDRLREDGSVTLPGDCPPPAPGGRGGHGGRPGGADRGSHGARSGGGSPGGGRACTPTAVSTGQGGGGAGRMQAMLASLGLDAAQQAKVRIILAASQAQTAKLRENGDFQGLRQARQATSQQIEAVLRPDQKAKFEVLRAQAGPPGGGGGGSGAGRGSRGDGPGPGGDEGQEPSARGGGAPPADLPPSAAGVPAAGRRGSLAGPHAAATATEGGDRGADSGGAAGRGGGGVQALLGQLDLDPTQQARAQAIFATARGKAQAAYAAGDPDAAHAARGGALRELDAILRPEQKAKLAAARARMSAGGAGSDGGR